MTTTEEGELRPRAISRTAIERRGVYKHVGNVRAVRGVDLTTARV